MSEGVERAKATIERLLLGHDWMVLRVSEEGDPLVWSYTIGLWERLAHPEIITFGLPTETSRDILNQMGDEIRDDGAVFEPGKSYDRLIEGSPMKVVAADPPRVWDYVQGARWYYLDHLAKDDVPPFVQCVWPDRAGKFPGEFGWRKTSGWPQPILKKRFLSIG